MRLRTRWPGLFLTETHPKVLYYALKRQPILLVLNHRLVWLQHKMNCKNGPEVNTDDEWDALISAWAAKQARETDRDEWPNDLQDRSGDVLKPLDEVHYWWPEKLPEC